jgi:hypothetical protein
MGNHAIFGGGGGDKDAVDRFACPYSFRSSWFAKEAGDCGSCGKGCEVCRTICDLPSGVYAFKRGGIGQTSKAIDDPEAYTYCGSSTTLGGGAYYPQTNGAENYYRNGGADDCYVPYTCSGATCSPVSIYDGCWDASGDFRVDSNNPDQASVSADFTECQGSIAFTQNGPPRALSLPTESHPGVIAARAGAGSVTVMAVVGVFFFKKSQSKKRTLLTLGDQTKMVEMGTV